MDAELHRLLSELIAVLLDAGHDRWAAAYAALDERVVAGDRAAAPAVLATYGGMGSINDLDLGDARFDALRTQVFERATALVPPTGRPGPEELKVVARSRADRRRDRRARVAEAFAPELVERALDLLELMELAWHDCYGEVTPPEPVVDDVLVLGDGSLADLVGAARLAVIDWRDTRLAAQARRSGFRSPPEGDGNFLR